MLLIIAIISICVVIFVVSITKKYTKENFISDDEFKNMFEEHIKKFGYEKYRVSTSEYNKRFQIYKNNMLNYTDIGNKGKFPNYTFKTGETKFTSWTPEEYRSLFYGSNICENYVIRETSPSFNIIKNVVIPPKYRDEYNYYGIRNQHGKPIIMRKVRNQGTCGTCWAFAIIQLIESLLIIDCITNPTNKKINADGPELSVQQIIDTTSSRTGCDINFPAKGCGGISVMQDILELPQLSNTFYCTEDDYPYVLITGDKTYNYDGINKCDKILNQQDKFMVNKFNYVGLVLSEQNIQKALYYFGPLSLEVHFAANPLFGSYLEGIFNGPSKYVGTGYLNHSRHEVILCGWGKDKGLDYWICKNSWGTVDWGYRNDPKGYFYIPRNYADPDINSYDQKYGYGAMGKNLKTITFTDPCAITPDQEPRRPGKKSIYNFQITKKIFNYNNNSSEFIAEFYGEDFNVEDGHYPIIQLLGLNSTNLRTTKNKYVTTNNNLIDLNSRIVGDNTDYYFSDKNHTKKNANGKDNRFFYYRLVFKSDQILYNIDSLENSQTTLIIQIKAYDRLYNFFVYGFKLCIQNFDNITGMLTILTDERDSSFQLDNIYIVFVVQIGKLFLENLQKIILKTGTNTIPIKLPTDGKVLSFFLTNDASTKESISNTWYLV